MHEQDVPDKPLQAGIGFIGICRVPGHVDILGMLLEVLLGWEHRSHVIEADGRPVVELPKDVDAVVLDGSVDLTEVVEDRGKRLEL